MFQVAGEEIKVGDLKVADLKARLAALGEPTSGKKAELVDRLTKAVAKSKKRSAPPPAPPTSRHMVVASARAAELAASLPDDQVCDLPPPCDEAESKEEGARARTGYHRTRKAATEDEDEAAREDLLMLVEARTPTCTSGAAKGSFRVGD